MKVAQYFASFAIVALVLSASAFAKDNHSGNFTLSDTVEVGSSQLSPGNYKAEWTGSGDAVKIEILKNGKTVATVDGKLKQLQRPSPYDAVSMKTTGNDTNTRTIGEIDFSNRTEALILGGE